MPARSMNSTENFLIYPEGAAEVNKCNQWGRELRILDHAILVRFQQFAVLIKQKGKMKEA